MATYAQWYRGTRAARFVWVCGSERVLAEEVVAAVTIRVSPRPENYVTCTAGEFPERDLWTAAAAYPPDLDAPRLIVVREAQKLSDWEPLTDLIAHARDLPQLHMTLVSADDALAKQKGPDGRVALAAYLAALRDSSLGQMVVCSLPAENDLIAWVKRRLPGAGDNLAYHLLTRCGGNLAIVAAVCAKASLFPDRLGTDLVDEFCLEEPAVGFADALTAGDKATALAAADAMDPVELGAAVGLLDSRLDTLAVLNTAAAAGLTPAEMRTRLRLPQFVVAKYRKAAGDYPANRVRDRRAVLAAADAAWRQGARTGVAEFICALW